jgi:hypothetical protein
MAIPIIDPFGAMQQGLKMREARQQYESKNKLNDLYRTTDWSNPQAIERAIPQAIAAGGPEAASSFVTLLGHMDDAQRRRAESHRKDVGRVFLQIANSPEERRAALWQQGQGLYPQEFDQPYSPEALRAMQYELQDFDKALESYAKPETPYSDIAKAKADLDAGRITPAEYQALTRKATYIAPQTGGIDTGMWEVVELPGVGRAQRNKRTGQVQSLPGQTDRAPTAFATWLEAFRNENQRNPNAKEIQDYGASMRDQFIYGDMGTGPVGGGTYNSSSGTFDTAPAPAVSGSAAPSTPSVQGTSSGPTIREPGGSTGAGTNQGASTYGPGSTPDNRVTVSSHAEWEALPPGTYYKTTDGKTGRR